VNSKGQTERSFSSTSPEGFIGRCLCTMLVCKAALQPYIEPCLCNGVRNTLSFLIFNVLYFIFVYYSTILLSVCEFYFNELFLFSVISKNLFPTEIAVHLLCTS